MKEEAQEANWIVQGSGVVVVIGVVSLTLMTAECCSSTSLAVASAVPLTASVAAAAVEAELAVSLP